MNNRTQRRSGAGPRLTKLILSRILPCLTVAAAASAGSARPARASCQLPSPNHWQSAVGIPVQVNAHLPDYLCTARSCPTLDEIRRVTQVVMDDIFENSGARIRFDYAGDADRNFNDQIPGSIHVTMRTKSCPERVAGADRADQDDDGAIDACRIELCQGTDWTSMQADVFQTGNEFSLQSAIEHEMLHCLGLDHPARCGQDVATLLNDQGTTPVHHMFADDINGLRGIYGARSWTSQVFASNDGQTWVPWTAPPALVSDLALGRFAACQTATGSSLIVAYPQISENHPTVWARFDPLSWTLPDYLPWASGPYHPGAACASTNDVLVAWFGGYDPASGRGHLFLSQSANAGASWSTVPAISDSTDFGVSATYDPASGRYLAAFRSDGSDAVISKVLPDGADTFHFIGNLTVRSAESVGLACGDPAVLGPQNCIMTWVSTEWDRFLWYAHGSIVVDKGGARFTFDKRDVYAFPVVIFGQPSIAYVQDPVFPWMLSFHHDQFVHTMRKKASVAAAWEELAPFTPSGAHAISSPILGTLAAPAKGRGASRFLFVSSDSTERPKPREPPPPRGKAAPAAQGEHE